MIRDPVEAVFIDLDDCLYQNGWATKKLMRAKMEEYVSFILGLPDGTADELLLKHGCVLKGLVHERYIYDRRAYEFRSYPYSWFSLNDINKDLALREILLQIRHPLWCFTNHPVDFAYRILRRIGIDDVFEGVISSVGKEVIHEVGYVAKNEPKCIFAAMKLAGVSTFHASRCILLDDCPRCLKGAKDMGWQTVLVGRFDENSEEKQTACADVVIDRIHDLHSIVPDWFDSC